MDQESFRSLLAAPARPGAGRSAAVLGGPAPKRGHGGTYGSSSSKFTKVDLAQKKEDKPGFVPRKTKKDGKYKDRAEMRRLGLDDEYKPVEQLLHDFERRAQEGGEDASVIEEQRKYLGGDAEHSILVKGLDYGLLAARKAELDAQNADRYDDELDDLLVGGSTSNDGGGVGGDGGSGVRTERTTRKGKEKERPKTRDEIVAELKRKRMDIDGDTEKDDIMGVIKKSKVVNDKPKVAALPSKFKSIAKTEQVVDTPIKKKKKKIKTKLEEVEVNPPPAAAEAVTTTISPSSTAAAQAKDQLIKPERESELETKANLELESKLASPPQPPATLPAPESDDDMDGDIFGGVGDYELNIDSSDDDDNDETHEEGVVEEDSTPILPSIGNTVEEATEPRARRNWFGDEVEEPLSSSIVPEPSTERPSRRLTSRSLSPSDEEEDVDPSRPLQKLQPLSSSALPSAKDLLAADKAAEAADKKQASKARWRAKQGLSKQDGQDDDDDDDEDRSRGLARQKEDRKGEDKMRMHRDAQMLESYMSKKDKGKST